MYQLTQPTLFKISIVLSILFCVSLYARKLMVALVFLLLSAFLWTFYIQEGRLNDCNENLNTYNEKFNI
jgi:hypothetical protein